MRPIRTSARQILISALLVYLSALMMATDACTRVSRAAFPADYVAVALHWTTSPWLPPDYRTTLHHWQTQSQNAVHAWFQSEWLGAFFRCES